MLICSTDPNVSRSGLRQRRGLTSRALGKLLGVSNAYIIQIENGQRRPSIDVAEISRYFQVPADQLIKDELEVDV